MIAVGLALPFYSMLDDGSPNWFGLVLLFVGIGYVRAVVLRGPAAPRGGARRTPAPVRRVRRRCDASTPSCSAPDVAHRR